MFIRVFLVFAFLCSTAVGQEYTQDQLTQDLVESIECNERECWVVGLPQVVRQDDEPSLQDIRDLFPIFPRPDRPDRPENPAPEDPVEDRPQPEDPVVEEPCPECPEPEDNDWPLLDRLLKAIGNLLFGFLNIPVVQLVLGVFLFIFGFGFLSKLLTPIYGQDWLGQFVGDVITQVTSAFSAIIGIFTKGKDDTPEE